MRTLAVGILSALIGMMIGAAATMLGMRVWLHVETLKDVTEIVVAFATVVGAGSLVVALLAYKDVGRSALLQRTMQVLSDTSEEGGEEHRKALFSFEGRWGPKIVPMSSAFASALFEAGLQPCESENYKKWNAARKHLNSLETLSFAYVYRIADRHILAETVGLEIVRSAAYFAELIKLVAEDYPTHAHTWLIIPKAAKLLEEKDWARG